MSEAGKVIVAVLTIWAFTAAGLIGGFDAGRTHVRREAVERGYGEWFEENGELHFRWKDMP